MYELGRIDVFGTLTQPFVRGDAYLAAHQGTNAAREFQKVLNYRNVLNNAGTGVPLDVLSQLGLARAHRMEGNISSARSAYQAFLTIWKDADPDIPVLRQAQVEYQRI